MQNQEDKQNEPEVELLDFDTPTFKFEPKQFHEWRQQGPYIVCKTCDLEHAQWIGMDKLLIGINEQGQPLFKDK